MLKTGNSAPLFCLNNQEGQVVCLEAFIGKKVVIFFYPLDDTPGWNKQASGFRDAYSQFADKGVAVIGISKDSVASHKVWAEKFNLPFTLLSDSNLEAITKYGVLREYNLAPDNIVIAAARSTFVIDEKGNIEIIFENAKPDTNAQEILDYLK